MKRVVQNPAFREALLLTKNGVPFDLAFRLDPTIRAGFCIIMGELEGGEFDWGTMAFKEPSA